MVEMDAVVQGDVEQRLLLAVVFVGQLAVFELDGLAFGQERYLNRFSPARRWSRLLCFAFCRLP